LPISPQRKENSSLPLFQGMNMRLLLLFLLLFSATSFAGFNKITMQNLDLEYAAPYGKGTVDKVGIGMSLRPETFDLEIKRTENAFELTSPYVDFTWNDPIKFIYDIEYVTTKKTSAALGANNHFIESDYVLIQPKGRGEYKAHNVKGSCSGGAVGSFEDRLVNDCLKKMDLTISKVDVPTDFILYKLRDVLPTDLPPEIDIPGDNVVMRVNDGYYSLQVYIKYWFYAGLRSWGHVQMEDDRRTVAIRVDLIKFGYLPVTNLVMRKLQEVIKNPDVKIDPPWIRINIGKKYENAAN
jgi:hypothetical protein